MASITNKVNVITKYDVKTILLLNSVALGNDVLPSWERVCLLSTCMEIWLALLITLTTDAEIYEGKLSLKNSLGSKIGSAI